MATKEYFREWYLRNKDWYLPRVKDRFDQVSQKLRELKESVPCADCGNFFPYYVMQFDHVTGEKFKSISKMRSYSWGKILAEIEKCEIVCANCHAIRTHVSGKFNQRRV